MPRKIIFGTKKHHLAKTSGEKISSLNITDLGCVMPLIRQLSTWITRLKSVADQLIHDDNTFR